MTIELIEALKAEGVTVKADGDFLELSPAEKITDDLIQQLRTHKPAILAELRREERREKVLRMLAENPNTQRIFVTDTKSDSNSVILTFAIRDQYTFEMLIPQEKYDAFLLLELIDKAQIQ
ncbi:hypothetical protein C8R26_11457 [Nitrosomonas oligotropha]|uniref:TubC N-terminal docking domain-containing protein n=1 Tax=Nitrosomonas oligotropha TaxID=42354 RepID=A0A2T5HZ29_9PROT|nr:hypothetical protein [Nitrosomonas oligotropha]PTQ76738.1 hypothetical protein C8R26_11457 [Nitrosomonas oligotropha]